ncbi:MAG: F0F1 ATP synthase subunit epsilon [Ectothiorhodospiraceae bacterium]|nr:F0F1 ATP synthase subunit epsilon [Ectothiorhodospiraceae bacterium]
MRLTVSTPTTVVVDEAVTAVRAEDASGRFGLLPGHARLVTALVPSVLSWRRPDGSESFCAVRGGVLTVESGSQVAVATQEAVRDDDHARLESEVLARLRATAAASVDTRTRAARLQIAAVQQLLRFARPPREPGLARPGDEDGPGGRERHPR